MRHLAPTMLLLAASTAAHAQVMISAWGTNEPVQTPGHFKKIAVGGSVAAGLRTDGSLQIWAPSFESIPLGPAVTFVDVDVFNACIAAVDSAGAVHVWGSVPGGLAGAPPAGQFKAVDLGVFHAILTRTDGTLVGWGNGSAGVTNVPAGTFLDVACGVDHCIGLRTDGTLVGWGSNIVGQAAAPAGTFVKVDAGYNHSVALRADGTAAVWGSNNVGQAAALTGAFVDVGASSDYTVGVRANGTFVTSGSVGFSTPQSNDTFWSVAAGSFSIFSLKAAPITLAPAPPAVASPYGQTAVLSIAASSEAPLEYRWTRDGAALADGGRISGSQTAALFIDDAGLDDEGAYTVTVTNYTGAEESHTFDLSLIPYAAPGPDAGFDPFTGHAVEFNGAGTNAAAPHAAAHNPASSFTAEAWVRLDADTPGTWRVPLASQDFFSGAVSRRGYLFIVRESNWECWMGAGESFTVLSGPEIRLGEWTHLAVVRAGLESRFYVNGELAATAPLTSFVANSRQPLVIGCGLNTANAPAFHFPGAVDEVRVWNAARSEAQIKSLMNTAPLSNDPNLMARWAFDEGEGTTIHDLAPAGGAVHAIRTTEAGWLETFGAFPAGAANACPSDLTGDGLINAADLTQLLGSWGPCN